MAGRLANKAAIVTGGASGFGAGISECFVREGAKVLIADLDAEAGTAKAKALTDAGGTAVFHQVDVTDAVQVDRMVATCEQRFGAVDIMVANAGLGQRPCRLDETPPAVIDTLLDVNIKGVIHCCSAVLPVFRRQQRGNIIITASGIALLPRPNLVVYGATKGAVLVLAKGLAAELAPDGFRVNALCPAAGDTPMLAEFMGGEETPELRAQYTSGMPLGRLITPKDMGEAAVFLASDDEAATITGTALAVDSGRCL